MATVIALRWALLRAAKNERAAEDAIRREVLEKPGGFLRSEKGKAVRTAGGDRGRYAIGSMAGSGESAGQVLEAEPVRALPPGEEDKPGRPE